MNTIIEMMSKLYWPYLPQLLLQSLWYADWKSAYRHFGIFGLCKQALRSSVGFDSYLFYVPMGSGWSHRRIQLLLARHGIKIWGWAFRNHALLFRTKEKQAAWAQYVMLRAGVPLQGPLLAQAPDTSTTTTAIRERQSQRSASSPNDLTMDVERQLEGLIEKVSSFLDL